MKREIWNFWAKRYSGLWVQKYSLGPTRGLIVELLKREVKGYRKKLLDLGCGPGELIGELSEAFNEIDITGVDFSDEMIRLSEERNQNAKHIIMDVEGLEHLKGSFDYISCTHSLPYYRNKPEVFKNIYRLLNKEGTVFVAFASANSFYDKIILFFVKLTTGPATYPSDLAFRGMINGYFDIEELKVIKKKWFMPTIAVYSLKKVTA